MQFDAKTARKHIKDTAQSEIICMPSETESRIVPENKMTIVEVKIEITVCI